MHFGVNWEETSGTIPWSPLGSVEKERARRLAQEKQQAVWGQPRAPPPTAGQADTRLLGLLGFLAISHTGAGKKTSLPFLSKGLFLMVTVVTEIIQLGGL